MARREGTHTGWSSPSPPAWRPPRPAEAPVGDRGPRYLVALGVVGALFVGRLLLPPVPAPLPTPAESLDIGWYPAEQADGLARDIFDRVNDERVARGLEPVAWDEDLASMARQWSTRMIEVGYEHSPDSYRTHARFPWGMSENIAMGQETSEEVHVGWMLSDGHRYNILESSHGTVGIGVVCRRDGRMWATQLFGPDPYRLRPGSVGPPPNDGPEPVTRRDPGVACPRSLLYKAALLLR